MHSLSARKSLLLVAGLQRTEQLYLLVEISMAAEGTSIYLSIGVKIRES
jgi:hypothetical protein